MPANAGIQEACFNGRGDTESEPGFLLSQE